MNHDALKFQTDENISKVVINGLQRRGADVLSTPKAGLKGATDEEQLAFATQQGRVLVTHDDDFLSLHARGIEHSGIIFIQPNKPIGDTVRGLHLIYQVLTVEDMRNHVEFV